MALPASTLATYQAIGNREDLSTKSIASTRPKPRSCRASSGKRLRDPARMADPGLGRVDGSNAVLEGDDATTDTVTVTVRLSNICQISDKVARVTGTQEAVDHAGRGSEIAYQEMLKGLELKRDIETILPATRPR
jgi:hypothetical protein